MPGSLAFLVALTIPVILIPALFVAVPESSRYTTTTAYPARDPPPPDAPSIPAYQADWRVTVIDRKEIRRVGTFNGSNPPGAWVTFQGMIGSDQICVYDSDERVDGAEILWGDKSGIAVNGRPLVGIVGAVPWDETLRWIKEALGVGQG